MPFTVQEPSPLCDENLNLRLGRYSDVLSTERALNLLSVPMDDLPYYREALDPRLDLKDLQSGQHSER